MFFCRQWCFLAHDGGKVLTLRRIGKTVRQTKLPEEAVDVVVELLQLERNEVLLVEIQQFHPNFDKLLLS